MDVSESFLLTSLTFLLTLTLTWTGFILNMILTHMVIFKFLFSYIKVIRLFVIWTYFFSTLVFQIKSVIVPFLMSELHHPT